MKETKNYSINKNGKNYSLPCPGIISDEALKNAMHEKNTGILAVYDPVSMAGGIIHPEIEYPQWMIRVPITQEDFTCEINETIKHFVGLIPGIH